jgi:1,4-alpha-glucan branching enzyme
MAGDGYLNFIGNEFGHPEWVDFPREGNGWSYHYARRQWSLRDNKELKYGYLADFDRALMRVGEEFGVLNEPWPHKHYEHVADMVIAYERAGLLFVCNLHPTNSYEGRAVSCRPGRYSVVLDSDSGDNQLRLYLPSRTALVLKKL